MAYGTVIRSSLWRYCIVGFNKEVSELAVIGCILNVPLYVDVLWASMRGRGYLLQGRSILKAVSLDIWYSYFVRLMWVFC
jgi:hypothetical protein